jgi:hypothetical protein
MLEDDSLSFPGGTSEVSLNLGATSFEIARVFFNEELHVHLPGVIFDVTFMIAKSETGVLDLRGVDSRSGLVELREVVVFRGLEICGKSSGLTVGDGGRRTAGWGR